MDDTESFNKKVGQSGRFDYRLVDCYLCGKKIYRQSHSKRFRCFDCRRKMVSERVRIRNQEKLMEVLLKKEKIKIK